MRMILDNIRRIFFDDGRDDRDFSEQESVFRSARAPA